MFSIYKILFLALKKVQMYKITPCQIPTSKISPAKQNSPSKISYSPTEGIFLVTPNTTRKTLMMGDIHLSPKLKKYILINAFYVYNHQNALL